MLEGEATSTSHSKLDIGVLIHASAGIIALVVGGLMYSFAWALPVFSGLMILSAVSAALISWRLDAWVPSHWLAILPIVGIGIGYYVSHWGYTFAYICLWVAFLDFVIRGYRKVQKEKQAT